MSGEGRVVVDARRNRFHELRLCRRRSLNSGTAAQPKGHMRWSIDPRGRDVMFFGSVITNLASLLLIAEYLVDPGWVCFS
jgi:hypothetical protein